MPSMLRREAQFASGSSQADGAASVDTAGLRLKLPKQLANLSISLADAAASSSGTADVPASKPMMPSPSSPTYEVSSPKRPARRTSHGGRKLKGAAGWQARAVDATPSPLRFYKYIVLRPGLASSPPQGPDIAPKLALIASLLDTAISSEPELEAMQAQHHEEEERAARPPSPAESSSSICDPDLDGLSGDPPLPLPRRSPLRSCTPPLGSPRSPFGVARSSAGSSPASSPRPMNPFEQLMSRRSGKAPPAAGGPGAVSGSRLTRRRSSAPAALVPAWVLTTAADAAGPERPGGSSDAAPVAVAVAVDASAPDVGIDQLVAAGYPLTPTDQALRSDGSVSSGASSRSSPMALPASLSSADQQRSAVRRRIRWSSTPLLARLRRPCPSPIGCSRVRACVRACPVPEQERAEAAAAAEAELRLAEREATAARARLPARLLDRPWEEGGVVAGLLAMLDSAPGTGSAVPLLPRCAAAAALKRITRDDDGGAAVMGAAGGPPLRRACGTASHPRLQEQAARHGQSGVLAGP